MIRLVFLSDYSLLTQCPAVLLQGFVSRTPMFWWKTIFHPHKNHLPFYLPILHGSYATTIWQVCHNCSDCPREVHLQDMGGGWNTFCVIHFCNVCMYSAYLMVRELNGLLPFLNFLGISLNCRDTIMTMTCMHIYGNQFMAINLWQ